MSHTKSVRMEMTAQSPEKNGSSEELVGKRSRAQVFGGMAGQKEYRWGRNWCVVAIDRVDLIYPVKRR